MKSWKITAPENIELISDPSEDAGVGEVKIKINQCDLSRADVELYAGNVLTEYPRILGKLCIGMVTEIGEGVTEFARGDRVVTTPMRFCDNCVACQEGRYSACENIAYRGVDIDGYMRDFAIVKATEIYKLPDRIPDTDAMFLDCVSTAIMVLSTLAIKRGEHVVITDAGALGQIIAQVALYSQAVPIIIDINEGALQTAENAGIYYTINSVKSDPYKKIFSLTGGKMAETVVLISGNPAILPQALKFATRGGRVTLVNKYGLEADLNCNLSPVMQNGLILHGVNYTQRNLSTAINMLANHAVKTDGLVASSVQFENVGKFIAEIKNNFNEYQKYIVEI